ncbi:hypothetical protein SAMN05428969_3667 [Devosia sp. YR412]|uniref:DUF2076 domain-containing protein n=1 Tax=Devosia sp. YR412 TaxID=1881030 RepID=UPI0008D3C398|nr:DUF2076 domain-containing protein [Devosia sp. YR412]SEQ60465.1 hypothetical protein SAMN05428969_3667 [Devosia sp. YR412]
MPNSQDQQAIDSLFDRIEEVARKSAPRDADAEVMIQQRLRDYPPAPYYMAQTILIQEQALRQAQERIEQLEASQRPAGGFLGGLFGGEEPQRQPQARARGPWDRQQQDDFNRRGVGGGFLAGAAQTALGVTGGVLLGSAIAGMFAGGVNAAEVTPIDEAPQPDDQDFDAGGDDLGGGDFDFGGDF